MIRQAVPIESARVAAHVTTLLAVSRGAMAAHRLATVVHGSIPLSPEPSILARVAAGEPGAAAECLRQFRGLVWSLARRLCPSATEAEDAVQEIFIDVWRSAGRYDASIASEATFVATIARRRLIDRARRRKRRPEQALVSEGIAARVAEGDTSEQAEVAQYAQRAFERLRPEQRRVLHLSIRNGQSHEQIASTTGLPLGTVKTHARRGLIKLRELLAAEGFAVDDAALRDEGSAAKPPVSSPEAERPDSKSPESKADGR